MFDAQYIISRLEKNKSEFGIMLSLLSEKEILFKPRPEKWCLLEVACHLHDEEREDFRERIKSVLESPETAFRKIDPAAWVTERKYMAQDFEYMLKQFLNEREESVKWLRSLKMPHWDNAYMHPKVGPVTARLLLTNWLAHDFLHMRQILKLKYDFLRTGSGEKMDYAGDVWE
jgi:hypothetical protein